MFGIVYEVRFPERRFWITTHFPGCDLSIILRVAELNVWPKKLYRWAASSFTDVDALVFPAAFGC